MIPSSLLLLLDGAVVSPPRLCYLPPSLSWVVLLFPSPFVGGAAFLHLRSGGAAFLHLRLGGVAFPFSSFGVVVLSLLSPMGWWCFLPTCMCIYIYIYNSICPCAMEKRRRQHHTRRKRDSTTTPRKRHSSNPRRRRRRKHNHVKKKSENAPPPTTQTASLGNKRESSTTHKEEEERRKQHKHKGGRTHPSLGCSLLGLCGLLLLSFWVALLSPLPSFRWRCGFPPLFGAVIIIVISVSLRIMFFDGHGANGIYCDIFSEDVALQRFQLVSSFQSLQRLPWWWWCQINIGAF